MKIAIQIGYSEQNRQLWAQNPYGVAPTGCCPSRDSAYGVYQANREKFPHGVFQSRDASYQAGFQTVSISPAPIRRPLSQKGEESDDDQQSSDEEIQPVSDTTPLLEAQQQVDQPGVTNSAEPQNPYQAFSIKDQRLKWSEGWFAMDLDGFLGYRSGTPHRYSAHNAIGDRNAYQFCLVGCQGVGNTWLQGSWRPGARKARTILETVAYHVDVVRKGSEFTWLLGDNFYQFGIDSPRAPEFSENFIHYFKNKPAFCILGNHDWNIHSQSYLKKRRNRLHAAMCQVYHSYIKRWEPDPNKPSSRANRWNMPFRYYAMTSHKQRVHFIAIDSNTIVFDKAQQKWLKQVYDKLATVYPDYAFILISHHPLKYYSKRQYKGTFGPDSRQRTRFCSTQLRNYGKAEWKKYVQYQARSFCATLAYGTQVAREDLAIVPTYYNVYFTDDGNPIPGIDETNYNAVSCNNTIGRCIQFLLQHYDLRFKAMFAAHEHLLAMEELTLTYGNQEHKMWQIISGGGGADLNTALEELKTNGAQVYPAHGYVHANLQNGELHLTPTVVASANRCTTGVKQKVSIQLDNRLIAASHA